MSNDPENTNVPTTKDVFDQMSEKANKFIRKKPQKRIEWSQEELDALEEGMKKFGTNWILILNMDSGLLNNRTNVQLKDKARNEKRRREREGIPLGVFERATG